MIDYTSLKIVRVLEFGWIYYPNGLTTGFGISKGYFSFDETDSKLQIVEDGRAKRPKVSLVNVTFEDVYSSEAEISFATFVEMQNTLALKNCPLCITAITINVGGISQLRSAFYTGAGITVPSGFSGVVINMNNTNAVVTYTVSTTIMTITSGVDNGDRIIF